MTNLCGDWNSELFAIEVDPENNDPIINAIFQRGQQLLRNKFNLTLSTCPTNRAFSIRVARNTCYILTYRFHLPSKKLKLRPLLARFLINSSFYPNSSLIFVNLTLRLISQFFSFIRSVKTGILAALSILRSVEA